MTPNDEVEQIKLLNCPFCDGNVLTPYLTGNNPGNDYWVHCDRCGASSGLCNSKDEAISSWNTRQQSPSSGLRELDSKELKFMANDFYSTEQFSGITHEEFDLTGYVNSICSKFGTKQEMPTAEEIEAVILAVLADSKRRYNYADLAYAVLALIERKGKE